MTSDNTQGLAPGSIIDGKFRVEKTLGIGGFGAVYLVTHVELGTRRAVKVLLKRDSDLIERFRREGRIGDMFQDPHVAKVYDCVIRDDLAYMVMEYVEGETLKSATRRLRESGQRYSISETVRIGISLFEGIVALHACSIAHRDLKPENLFLCQDAQRALLVKILDLGIARCVDDEASAQIGPNLTKKMTIMGSINYMAPEQMADTSLAGCPADIFAAGGILFRLLTGKSAYPGDSLPEKVVTIALAEHPPSARDFRPETPEELAVLVAQCLEKKQEDRPAAVEVLQTLKGITIIEGDFAEIPSSELVEEGETPHTRGAFSSTAGPIRGRLARTDLESGRGATKRRAPALLMLGIGLVMFVLGVTVAVFFVRSPRVPRNAASPKPIATASASSAPASDVPVVVAAPSVVASPDATALPSSIAHTPRPTPKPTASAAASNRPKQANPASAGQAATANTASPAPSGPNAAPTASNRLFGVER